MQTVPELFTFISPMEFVQTLSFTTRGLWNH